MDLLQAIKATVKREHREHRMRFLRVSLTVLFVVYALVGATAGIVALDMAFAH